MTALKVVMVEATSGLVPHVLAGQNNRHHTTFVKQCPQGAVHGGNPHRWNVGTSCNEDFARFEWAPVFGEHAINRYALTGLTFH
jgi:hypothetical protein